MLFSLDILCLLAMVFIRRLLLLFPITSIPDYQQVFFSFTRNTLSTFFCCDQILQKIMQFQSKTNFLFQLIAGQFWLCCFVYVFLRTLFYSSAIVKLRMALHLLICIASFLSSHQIMWHKKTIYCKSQAVVAFLCFQGNYVAGWYYLHNFKLLISFWE